MSSTKAAAFRARFLSAKKPLIIVGAHDGLGAQLIERNGFDGVWASGLEISASHGVPDANILTMTQYLERAEEMNMASGLPIICDVDTGYGNSSNVHYMVQQYEAAGIAGIVMEDKLFPKVNSFMPGRQELASITEFCGKLEAAKAAQRGKDFLVIARVEALIAGWGMDEAVKRAEAYTKAGADAILMHSKSKEPDEIRAFLKIWKKRSPIVLVPTTYPALTYDEMAKHGVNMIIYANQCMRASITAMNEVLSIMQKEHSTVTIEKQIASVKDIFELQGMMRMKEHEKKYLRTTKPIHVIIPAAGKPNHEGRMAERLREVPVAMLDIAGKPLIHRIIEQVNIAGMQDVTVVTGYKSEMVKLATGTVHSLPEQSHGLLHSILSVKDGMRDSVLLHYGDVIVSHENLKSFVDSDAPITIMMSPLLREGRYSRKKFEFVSFAKRSKATRTLSRHPVNMLRDIGPHIGDAERDGEFVGLIFLSPEGVKLWKKTEAALKPAEKKTFSLIDFLQAMLMRKVPISTFEVRSGWAEIHSEDDVKQLESLFSA